jgi:hypothetical protein
MAPSSTSRTSSYLPPWKTAARGREGAPRPRHGGLGNRQRLPWGLAGWGGDRAGGGVSALACCPRASARPPREAPASCNRAGRLASGRERVGRGVGAEPSATSQPRAGHADWTTAAAPGWPWAAALVAGEGGKRRVHRRHAEGLGKARHGCDVYRRWKRRTNNENHWETHFTRRCSLETRRKPSVDVEPKIWSTNRRQPDKVHDETNAAVLSEFANEARIESNYSSVTPKISFW